MEISLISHRSINEKTYEAIKKNIINAKFPPGSRIHEDFLAEILGVSKTPIKIALAKLEKEGFVKILPRRGTYVAEITPDLLIEYYTLREVLEGLAAKLAVQYISAHEIAELKQVLSELSSTMDDIESCNLLGEKFHKTIINASKHALLQRTLDGIYDKIRLIKSNFPAPLEGRNRYHEEHIRIVEAIRKKNPVDAEQLTRLHINRVKDDFLRSLGTSVQSKEIPGDLLSSSRRKS